jgi:hypothetical protein
MPFLTPQFAGVAAQPARSRLIMAPALSLGNLSTNLHRPGSPAKVMRTQLRVPEIAPNLLRQERIDTKAQ